MRVDLEDQFKLNVSYSILSTCFNSYRFMVSTRISSKENVQTVEDVPLTAPQDSQNSDFAFMPTPGCNVSSSEPRASEPPTQAAQLPSQIKKAAQLLSQAKKSAQQTSQANKAAQHKPVATKKTNKQAITPSNMLVDEDDIDDAT
ncbi:hypothetical protein A4A49_40340 [Nicotiana attenuata]|uniref:Uncharacterized protein n=1 Tax=Nicotiana attenuata TaxID=49451 RepID=A0A1J6KE04_NICAT|nr:hypothetical protein A4A49_40340 [Nicotiana attenuata]